MENDECDDNFNDDDVDLGQKCDKEPLSRTTRDEKGQMRFHFLPHFALNCDLHYDVDDCDDDHYDEIGDDNIEKGQMSRNKKMTKSLVNYIQGARKHLLDVQIISTDTVLVLRVVGTVLCNACKKSIISVELLQKTTFIFNDVFASKDNELFCQLGRVDGIWSISRSEQRMKSVVD